MPRFASLKSVALDFLAGLFAFLLLLGWLILSGSNVLQLFALLTAVLFFLAGALRAADTSRNVGLKALVIGLGGIVPIVVMRVTRFAFTEYGYVSFFVVFSLLMAAAGAATRQLLARGRTWPASLLAVFSLVGATLAAVMIIPALVANWSSKELNVPVEAFSLATPDGNTVTSADLQGRVVVLAFWATWCAPCRQELPDLQQVYEHYKHDPNATFYAVGGPWGDDTIEKESAFAAQLNLALPLAFDSRGAAKTLGIQGFPALVILDRDGRVRLIHNGYDASEHLTRQVAAEVEALEGSHT
jgi:peroxiredoxin